MLAADHSHRRNAVLALELDQIPRLRISHRDLLQPCGDRLDMAGVTQLAQQFKPLFKGPVTAHIMPGQILTPDRRAGAACEQDAVMLAGTVRHPGMGRDVGGQARASQAGVLSWGVPRASPGQETARPAAGCGLGRAEAALAPIDRHLARHIRIAKQLVIITALAHRLV